MRGRIECSEEAVRKIENEIASLEEKKGCRFIVEDQTTFPKVQPDCWGVKPASDGVNFSGPNVFGRLLMELRDHGQLDYRLPDDALGYIKIL